MYIYIYMYVNMYTYILDLGLVVGVAHRSDPLRVAFCTEKTKTKTLQEQSVQALPLRALFHMGAYCRKRYMITRIHMNTYIHVSNIQCSAEEVSAAE